MKRHQKLLPRGLKSSAYRQAFERLDASLAANPGDNREKIQLMRMALFGEVDQLHASGTVKLPR